MTKPKIYIYIYSENALLIVVGIFFKSKDLLNLTDIRAFVRLSQYKLIFLLIALFPARLFLFRSLLLATHTATMHIIK